MMKMLALAAMVLASPVFGYDCMPLYNQKPPGGYATNVSGVDVKVGEGDKLTCNASGTPGHAVIAFSPFPAAKTADGSPGYYMMPACDMEDGSGSQCGFLGRGEGSCCVTANYNGVGKPAYKYCESACRTAEEWVVAARDSAAQCTTPCFSTPPAAPDGGPGAGGRAAAGGSTAAVAGAATDAAAGEVYNCTHVWGTGCTTRTQYFNKDENEKCPGPSTVGEMTMLGGRENLPDFWPPRMDTCRPQSGEGNVKGYAIITVSALGDGVGPSLATDGTPSYSAYADCEKYAREPGADGASVENTCSFFGIEPGGCCQMPHLMVKGKATYFGCASSCQTDAEWTALAHNLETTCTNTCAQNFAYLPPDELSTEAIVGIVVGVLVLLVVVVAGLVAGMGGNKPGGQVAVAGTKAEPSADLEKASATTTTTTTDKSSAPASKPAAPKAGVLPPIVRA